MRDPGMPSFLRVLNVARRFGGFLIDTVAVLCDLLDLQQVTQQARQHTVTTDGLATENEQGVALKVGRPWRIR